MQDIFTAWEILLLYTAPGFLFCLFLTFSVLSWPDDIPTARLPNNSRLQALLRGEDAMQCGLLPKATLGHPLPLLPATFGGGKAGAATAQLPLGTQQYQADGGQ